MTSPELKASQDSERARAGWLQPGRLLGAVAALLVLFQAGRLFRLIDRYSVDLPFWDQWDFYDPFFESGGFWRIFAHQHGPHRQGLGSLVIWLVNATTGWNQRAQCFVIGGTMLASAAIVLYLVWRLDHKLEWCDAIPVLWILSLQQWALCAHTPNIAHGAIPLLLVVLSGVAWTLKRRTARYAALVALNFLAVFTGFGLLAGIVTPLLLATDGVFSLLLSKRKEAALAGGSVLAALLTLVLFSRGYEVARASEGVGFPEMAWLKYPLYMGAEFAGFFGGGLLGAAAPLAGLVIVAALVAVFGMAARSVVATRGADARGRVVLLLLGFSLAFSAASSVGRVGFGLDSSASSRYVPLLVPSAIAVYLYLRGRASSALRETVTVALLGVTLIAAVPAREAATAEFFRAGKTAWALAFNATGSVEEAGGWANFIIYPSPEATHLREKLEWLKARRLSLFREDDAAAR